MPVVYVTHSLEELLALGGDNTVLISEGNCIQSGSVEDVVSNPANIDHMGGLTGRVSVLKAMAVDQHDSTGIISLTDKTLMIPTKQYKEGTKLRVTLRSEDVTISVKKPEGGLSARNIIKGGVVTNMEDTPPDGAVSIKIDIGVTVYATITQEAVSDLSIENNSEVFIILKTVALSRRSTATIRQ